MHETGHGRVLILPQRIQHLPRGNHHLIAPRNDLLANRAVRISPIDEVEKIRRDRERELLFGEKTAGFLLWRQGQVTLQLLNRGQPILQLPRPVLPI